MDTETEASPSLSFLGDARKALEQGEGFVHTEKGCGTYAYRENECSSREISLKLGHVLFLQIQVYMIAEDKPLVKGILSRGDKDFLSVLSQG